MQLDVALPLDEFSLHRSVEVALAETLVTPIQALEAAGAGLAVLQKAGISSLRTSVCTDLHRGAILDELAAIVILHASVSSIDDRETLAIVIAIARHALAVCRTIGTAKERWGSGIRRRDVTYAGIRRIPAVDACARLLRRYEARSPHAGIDVPAVRGVKSVIWRAAV